MDKEKRGKIINFNKILKSCLSYLFFNYLAQADNLNMHYHAFKGGVMQ